MDDLSLFEQEFLVERRGLRNILPGPAAPLHDRKERRSCIHLGQLHIAVAKGIAVQSGVRHGTIPYIRPGLIGGCRDGTSYGAVVNGYAHARIYERKRQPQRRLCKRHLDVPSRPQ